MDVFDNCRICLREINHEPIKITRIILRFLEKNLQLTNVAKPNPQENVKQNLCAMCFNRVSEFQDFLEQCKDSDEFWKAQFEDITKSTHQQQLTFDESILLPLIEDSNSLEADTTVSTTETKKETHTQSEEKGYENELDSSEFELGHSLRMSEEHILLPTSQITDDENETTQIESLNSVDLTNWADEAYDDEEVQINTHSESDANAKEVTDEIIEYEYRIEEDGDIEIEEFQTDETSESSTRATDYSIYDYEKVETEEAIEEQGETTQSAFFLTTSIDKNGKIKMTYKCPQCDKTFNRIYDIESHYNIHNGIKPFTCNVCGKSFRQKNILTTHQALHFGKKVECAECGKKFARRSQLILHYRMHRDEKPFVCDIDGCQAAFRQRKQLVDHSFIHTDEKNFQCATCVKSFHTRKRLQDHIYKVHSQHRYRCELCEKAFLKPHMLKQHMITAHNVEMDDVSHLKTVVDAVKPIRKIIH